MTPVEIIANLAAKGFTTHLDPAGAGLLLHPKNVPSDLIDLVRAHKTEIVAQLRKERVQIQRWINANFSSSPPDVCRHCRRGPKIGDAWVKLYCGDDSGVVHHSCWPAWQADGEAKARIALGFSREVLK